MFSIPLSSILSSNVARKLPAVPSLTAFLMWPRIPLTVRIALPSNLATSRAELNIPCNRPNRHERWHLRSKILCSNGTYLYTFNSFFSDMFVQRFWQIVFHTYNHTYVDLPSKATHINNIPLKIWEPHVHLPGQTQSSCKSCTVCQLTSTFSQCSLTYLVPQLRLSQTPESQAERQVNPEYRN